MCLTQVVGFEVVVSVSLHMHLHDAKSRSLAMLIGQTDSTALECSNVFVAMYYVKKLRGEDIINVCSAC